MRVLFESSLGDLAAAAPRRSPTEHLPTRRDEAHERFAHLLGALTADD
jgi:hypothetical protein